MLKRFEVFFLLTLLLTSSLFATLDRGYGRECCDSGCGNWKLDVEFLYFLPTFDDTYFVLQNSSSSAVPAGKRLNNDFNFRPGFRVGAAYELCGCCDGEFQAYYTRLSASHTRTVSGSFLWATIGRTDFASLFENYTGSASSHLDFLYQRADGLYSHHLWCNDCLKLDGCFGVEYAYVRLKEQYDFRRTGVFGTIDEKTRMWGIGPQFGIKLDYLVCQTSCWCPGAVSIVACTSSSLLVSRTEMDATNILLGNTLLDVSDEHTWRIVPAMHARVGLNYAACFSCWWASIEVGYEFTSYLRSLTRYSSPDDVGDGLCFTNYYNFDVQGLYVAANVSF